MRAGLEKLSKDLWKLKDKAEQKRAKDICKGNDPVETDVYLDVLDDMILNIYLELDDEKEV